MPITTTPRPREFAAIDLGSNSFHMVIARQVDGALQIIGRLKQRVHLADGLDQENLLSEEAIERGLACLALFAERLQGFDPASVSIIGTHTLRQARNAAWFVARAQKVIPYPIEVVSGNEEARLIFMGVAHTQPEKGRKLVIDIGGGSTELVIGEGFTPQLTESRRMGCVSFARRYFANGEISAQHFRQARLAAAQKLESLAWEYRLHGWNVALGASGTIKAINSVLRESGAADGVITPERLDDLVMRVLRYRRVSALDLPGLSEERRQVFAPGLAIMCGIFDALNIKTLRLSDGALREGVLYEMEGRFRHQDIRSRTAESLACQYHIDDDQARRVLDTTLRLYDQWQAQHPKQANPQMEALLKWSAMLHEVGLNINHSGMHHHSAYILENSNLPGFTQQQQNLMAQLVSCSRKSIKKEDLAEKPEAFPAMVRALRLGLLLNNQRQASSRPHTLELKAGKHHWTLRFPPRWLEENALVQLDLEQEQQYWQALDGWRLTVTPEE
ncbi:exopolyphosphatase [Shimwellia blattae]|uniref:Exopolyphosphatase n=1 Tax=Shimwellia blattae (strain ATCC 29907 / DSM 4481 / JCM 1650 / NBRC 105725 / CDC 9005-74) TaxID=630626 RepID=I2BBE2_SHIBC|nr:exopolyphosphatase [Shimwellia blattae]AFJ47846.1 exopolyphosphatase [Shimwellia blattae DSM 4481 = NBRC 105725]GAB79583.1 exopolyphosphatase [Shimwellia blattae DSM 4481 = NBRC 105725]VDY65342.1 Exopolyphosphatase [Shimwellia blattae]VEC24292.1 Exopolyphosphatase [Shimwellia blattae]